MCYLRTSGCRLYHDLCPLIPQETSGISFRKQLAASLAQHSARVDKVGPAHQLLSSASCSSSMEVFLIIY